MNIVPFRFIDEVLERLGVLDIKQIQELPPKSLWKEAADEFSEKFRPIYLDLVIGESSKLAFSCSGFKSDVTSLDLFFTMNPRYFKIQSVAISDNYQYPRPLIDLPDPSRERFLHVLGICLDQGNMGDLLVKVSKPASMNVLASIYKGLIGRAFFKRLTLIYAGVESQEFLEDQVNNNFRLSDVNVDSSRITEATHWPESTIPILVKAILNPKIQVVVAKPFVLDFEIYDQVVQAWMANGTIRKCLSSDLKSIPETLPDYYIQRSSPRYGISYALLVRHPTIKDYWLTWEISAGKFPKPAIRVMEFQDIRCKCKENLREHDSECALFRRGIRERNF